jgi:hypothetical protein
MCYMTIFISHKLHCFSEVAQLDPAAVSTVLSSPTTVQSGEIIIMIDRWKRMRINDDKSEMY